MDQVPAASKIGLYSQFAALVEDRCGLVCPLSEGPSTIELGRKREG